MWPCKANTMTHPEVRLTPGATHRAKNLNKTPQRRRDEVCVLRATAEINLIIVGTLRIYDGESL